MSKKGILLKRELLNKGLSEDKINTEVENWSKALEAKNAAKTKSDKKVKKEEPKLEVKEESIQEAEGTASTEETKDEA